MKPKSCPSSAGLLVLCCWLALGTAARAQDQAPDLPPEAPVTRKDARAEAFFARFARTAQSLHFAGLNSGEPYVLQERPLFRFTTEGTVFGSVYVWHDAASRLAAIGTIGALPIRGADTEFVELHLLKPSPIETVRIKGRPDKQWDPDVEGLRLRVFTGAPAVAKDGRQRLAQMKSLARQFSVEMMHRERVSQLRPLPQPIYRYADATADRDGALFAFVWDTGTDPELLLRIESTQSEGTIQWHYQPLRLTWRELRLQREGVEVWHAKEFLERDSPIQRSPYVTGLTEALP